MSMVSYDFNGLSATKLHQLDKIPVEVKGVIRDFFIFTLDQIIVSNKYCTYVTNIFPKYYMSKPVATPAPDFWGQMGGGLRVGKA